MKSWLLEILQRLDFCDADAAYLLEVYDKMQGEALWQTALSTYEADICCDFKALIEASDKMAEKLYLQEESAVMVLFLCMARHLRKEYKAKGISEEIFWDTIRDLAYKNEESKLVRGIVGTFVPTWYKGFFDMTRFALGRLQFEVKEFGYSYENNGVSLTPESKVLNVHIPRSQQPLRKSVCDEAFALAKAFFAEEVNPCVFVCSSWLLYPENERILSPLSNTYKFMKRFDIVSYKVRKDKNDLWRLFDTDEKNPEKLVCTSPMQEAYKAHLLKGGKLGSGFGVYVYNE